MKKYLPHLKPKLQRCLSPKSRKSSLFRRQQMQISSDKKEINTDSQKKEISIKRTNKLRKLSSLKKVKRAETSRDIFNKNSQTDDQSKFLKLISDFKIIKQKIRKSIILRPEDQDESNNVLIDNNINKKNKLNKKLYSTDKIINLKNAINIESPKAKNDVERSNTIIYNGNQSK